ncbi:MAG: DEAD/DEAH box helicase [Thermoplasmatota archaeon]
MVNTDAKGKGQGDLDIRDLFHPKTAAWFQNVIGEPTGIQLESWNSIKSGNNVVVVSPTGSGKTMAAVMPSIDDLVRGEMNREKVSILYISPMKAMGADLVKTLNELSEGIGRLPGKKEKKRGRKGAAGPKDAHIKVGIRTGDVPQSERRKMLVDPPDLLITTPENLLLMLCSKARDILKGIRYLIMDEVHEMISGKRGALLSLAVEYLEEMIEEAGNPSPIRVGLSATVRPHSLAARYVGGLGADGRIRNVDVVRKLDDKKIEIDIRTLMDTLNRQEDIYDTIVKDIGAVIENDEGSLVVFHNTRSMAEEMAYSLINSGMESVMPHHGSLGADVRKEAEEGLKNGELNCIVSSTSLELGIDIGSVNTVCQVSSPKDPGRMLQRFGRSGHGLGKTSYGIIYPVDGADLLECLGVVRAASRGNLESLHSPDGPLDVLSQFVIGLTLKGEGISKEEIFKISRRAYPYRNLRNHNLDSILSMLSERLPGPTQPPPRLWKEADTGLYYPRRNTRQAFYLNCGTIPKETNYRVIDERAKKRIGDLSRDFGEALYEGDVILLGSKSYRILKFSGSAIIVKEDAEASPTVPSWSGEVKPRSRIVSREIFDLYNKRWSNRTGRVSSFKVNVDRRGRMLLGELIEQQKRSGIYPAPNRIPVEHIAVDRSKHVYIFHLPLGRMVTDPVGRVMAYGIRRNIGARIDYVSTDDGFAISTPLAVSREDMIDSLSGSEFAETASRLIMSSSLFRTRFSHCLNKSLLVLARFRGKETGVSYRKSRVESLLALLQRTLISPEEPDREDPLYGLLLLGREAMKEVIKEKVDLDTSSAISEDLRSGKMVLVLNDPAKEPTVIGRSIIRSWRKTMPLENEAVMEDESVIEGRKELLNDIDTVQQSMSGDGSTYQDILSLLEGVDIDRYSPGKIAKKSGKGLEEVEEGIRIARSQGNMLSVRTVNGIRAIPLSEEMGIAGVPFSSDELMAGRIRGRGSKKLKKILESVPFFTHPLELISRSDRIDIDHIRSAVKGRRILPYRACGDSRQGDPQMADIFITLAPNPPEIPENLMQVLNRGEFLTRKDISDAAEITGETLTELIGSLMRSNVISSYSREAVEHLGAPEGYLPISGPSRFVPGDRSFQQSRAIGEFLNRLGPFTLEELSRIFGWEEGCYPPGVTAAIRNGRIRIGLGPKGPMEKGGIAETEVSLWLWNGGAFGRQPVSNPRDPNESTMIVPGTDHCLIFTGQEPKWIESDHVRGSRSVRLILCRGSTPEATCQILEMPDLIRVSDIEFWNFSEIGRLSGHVVQGLLNYLKLEYSVFVIEKIMGIPGGEAAKNSVDRFIEAGFSAVETPKGSLLISGADIQHNVTREDIIRSIFKNQHLAENDHADHPLKILTLLGSIADRWEILSRMSSSRHRRLSGLIHLDTEHRITMFMNRLISEIQGSDVAEEIRWEDVLSRSTEKLADMKDLSKRFNLSRGILDQSTLVWSSGSFFRNFPPPTRGSSRGLSDREKELLVRTILGDQGDIEPILKDPDNVRIFSDLVKKGFLLEDPWGSKKPVVLDDRYGFMGKKGRHRRSRHHRGVLQRAWVLMASRALGMFTLEDMINYSPALDDRCKMRKILKELSEKHIERFIVVDSGIDVVYRSGKPEEDPTDNPMFQNDDSGLVVISPKDRISRVVAQDIRRVISRGHGFMVFKGGKPVAMLSVKKLNRNLRHTEFGENLQGMSSLENWIVNRSWIDLRHKRDRLMREIRKYFFSRGCRLLSEEEKRNVENLYRDADQKMKT